MSRHWRNLLRYQGVQYFTSSKGCSDYRDNDFSDVCFRFDLREITEEECMEVCREYCPLGLDFTGYQPPTKATCLKILSENFLVFFSNIIADYDTDPSWILSRYKDLLNLNNTFFQIDLIEQMDDAWCFLKHLNSEDCNELTISDIINITLKHNIILNLNFTESNFSEILQAFPHICGVAFSLDQKSIRRSNTTQQIKNILRAGGWL